ncbi:hypothetical protein EMIHUDRAFT_250440 [Emiliania huxleyi CCMP1516]|uniref:Uncharacterized protein n=2 Tax=Emiliania huxleyi TaxID=2903 RepID=A0A0D3I0J1_EMIH1|nr:hypothetical protein EMIHUDRAFT_250440 [Emiliania huxleyi CCMP1516]EOD04776.1 hypothetical protein EMIHUDRAFT_250440 [Emiliania huxleyi CCMP1516]|eukprot:XP_005757205.1 hypothetical protein EMIHUDRAFT_250440 [Emiliania huxleyi CCMP1516]
MFPSTPNAALGGTTPATKKRPHELEPESSSAYSDRHPSKAARTGAGGLDGGVSDIKESATKSAAAEESAAEEAPTEEAVVAEEIESAADTLKTLGADALSSGTAEQLRGIAMSLWKLNDTFEQREAARKEAAAAVPTDDTFLGARVRLELDIVEQIVLQLPPKGMGVAARVNRHFLQALPNDPRRRNLGLAVDADEKVTTELLSQLEQQVDQVPALLERSEVEDLRRLGSFHHSVLHTLLDDERLLKLLEAADLSGMMAWRIMVKGKPTPAWAQRNKSAVEAALRASDPYSDEIFIRLCLLFRLMPASVAEEHVEDIGAVLARIAGSSCSPLMIGMLLDLLARLSTPHLARIRAKIDECWSACQANHAFNHLAIAPKVRALLAQANGTSI